MDSNSNPYWYRLIKIFKQKGIIKDGLTIPFLIGSYIELGVPFNSIDEMILSIHNSQIAQLPFLHKCPQIGQHVILIKTGSEVNNPWAKYFKLPNENKANYLVVDSASALGNSMEKIIHRLNSEYSKPILQKRFSWNNQTGEWEEFKKNTIELILSVK